MFENLQAKSVLLPTTFKLVVIDPKDKSKIADLYEDTNEQKVKMFADDAQRWNFHYAFERRTANPHNNNIFVEGYYCEGGIRKHYQYHQVRLDNIKYDVKAILGNSKESIVNFETDNTEVIEIAFKTFDVVYVVAFKNNRKFYSLAFSKSQLPKGARAA